MRRNNIRVVLDTNVIISAALFPLSLPGQVFEVVRNQGSLLMSADVLAEIDDVLNRPRFDRYLSSMLRLEFIDGLEQIANTVEITLAIVACRDPKDDKFLELAVNGQANFIVSGDSDLLELSPFRGIPVVPPRSFLAEALDSR